MNGLMMPEPLLISRLLWRAETIFADREVVTREEAGYRRATYRELGRRTRQLVAALRDLGIEPGDRVTTIAWNTHHHLEAYFAVPCMGAVLHTGNHRLTTDQLAYTINHARSRVVLVDPDLVGVLEVIADRLHSVRHYVVLGEAPEGSTLPLQPYERLLAEADPETVELTDFDENTAAAMCYTSGTTGDPKGVVYSHRSVVLHTLALSIKGASEVGEHDTVLTVTPMSHANAWGVPYACAMQGAKLVLPGVHPSPENILRIIEDERVTVCLGAVTIGTLLKQAVEAGMKVDLSSLERLWLGGQAPPRALIEWWRDTAAVTVVQGWGLTETSPVLTFSPVSAVQARGGSPEEVLRTQSLQGKPLPLVQLRVIDEDGDPLAWDGESVGEFVVRSPWVASEYLDDARTLDSFHDGWFRTGDVGVIHPDGTVQLKDRTKDMIKSGGEWISSVDLENALTAHPSVVEAVVIAVPDETWGERPLACVRVRRTTDAEDLRAHLAGRFPRYWIPDRFVFVEEIPKTSVGKFDKKLLRAAVRDGGVERLAEL